MSIANELSGDIAAAILSAKSCTHEKLIDLKETVIKVHYVLQELDNGNLKAPFKSHRSTDAGALKDPSRNN
ncbi:MAG TPA: hypothetical protein VE135_09135 [Pyrinomonadaceae bacterium]|nr:hypothetical protein [Pyrinomonadaceae bacterium]